MYVAGADPLHAWAFERRRILDLGATSMSIAPPEYVILRKLQYHRDSSSDRHLRDVAMILMVSDEQVDTGEIEAWVDRLDLKPEWAAARAYVPQ